MKTQIILSLITFLFLPIIPIHTASPRIGKKFAGGIVFFLDNKGGGLIVANSNFNKKAAWGGEGIEIGGTSTSIGSGEENTRLIVETLGEGDYAAKYCYDLVLGGYDDWYLPSRDELNILYKNLHLTKKALFKKHYHWSSTEQSERIAWRQLFYNGSQFDGLKSSKRHVRAIRSFSIND